VPATPTPTTPPDRRRSRSPLAWLDNQRIVDVASPGATEGPGSEPDRGESDPGSPGDGHRIDWVRCLPFIGLHVACLTVFLVGWSWVAVGVALGLYIIRMFAITGFYHRYFSHRTFRTSRPTQLLMAILGASAVQRGPMWWAAHHRHHHKHSDDPDDIHSPEQHGFWMAHMGWFMTDAGFGTNERLVRDWAKFPELKFLDRFDMLVPAVLAVACFGLGVLLETVAPGLGTSGWQMFVWGFLISTVACYHGTYTINSLAHTWGRRRYATDDDSRNNFILAIITLGEGWHNNHHHYPAAARQGFFWWEIDPTYYGLKVMQWLGLIWDLNAVPQRALERNRIDR
jgi:stearoyl-CoA desaturase (delta-9 desaturase)